MKSARETVAFLLLLILGLAPRLAFVSSFPTIPVSDFNVLVYSASTFTTTGCSPTAGFGGEKEAKITWDGA